MNLSIEALRRLRRTERFKLIARLFSDASASISASPAELTGSGSDSINWVIDLIDALGGS